MRGMVYFPFVGSLVGIFVSGYYDFLHVSIGLPTIIASAASLGASLWLTGCFHEDGLADSADGIGGGWSRKQILTIMTDTRLGTYGCAVLVLYIMAKLELVAALGTSFWTNVWNSDSDDSDSPNATVTTSSKGGGPGIVGCHIQ